MRQLLNGLSQGFVVPEFLNAVDDQTFSDLRALPELARGTLDAGPERFAGRDRRNSAVVPKRGEAFAAPGFWRHLGPSGCRDPRFLAMVAFSRFADEVVSSPARSVVHEERE